MNKSRAYRHSAAEACSCLLAVCVPHYQALLFAGMTGLISAILVTCLLLLMVARSPEAYHAVAASLRSLPASWIPPQSTGLRAWIHEAFQPICDDPLLAPSFQRPPPAFA